MLPFNYQNSKHITSTKGDDNSIEVRVEERKVKLASLSLLKKNPIYNELLMKDWAIILFIIRKKIYIHSSCTNCILFI